MSAHPPPSAPNRDQIHRRTWTGAGTDKATDFVRLDNTIQMMHHEGRMQQREILDRIIKAQGGPRSSSRYRAIACLSSPPSRRVSCLADRGPFSRTRCRSPPPPESPGKCRRYARAEGGGGDGATERLLAQTTASRFSFPAAIAAATRNHHVAGRQGPPGGAGRAKTTLTAPSAEGIGRAASVASTLAGQPVDLSSSWHPILSPRPFSRPVLRASRAVHALRPRLGQWVVLGSRDAHAAGRHRGDCLGPPGPHGTRADSVISQ